MNRSMEEDTGNTKGRDEIYNNSACKNVMVVITQMIITQPV